MGMGGLRVFLHKMQDQITQALLGIEVINASDFALQRQQAREVGVANLQQQGVFIAKVVINRGLGQPAGLRHRIHAGCGIALAGKQRGCLLQDLLTLIVIASRTPSSHA